MRLAGRTAPITGPLLTSQEAAAGIRDIGMGDKRLGTILKKLATERMVKTDM